MPAPAPPAQKRQNRSGLKRAIGDEIKARTPASAGQELLLKVCLYNHMNDDALAKGCTPTLAVAGEGWAGSKRRRGRKGGRCVEVPARTRGIGQGQSDMRACLGKGSLTLAHSCDTRHERAEAPALPA